MLDRRDNSLNAVDADYHAFRERARKSAFSPEEFSEAERERYDLETAGITGEDNDETYQGRDDRTGWAGDMRDSPIQ